jgi:putative membrane protein
MKTTLHLFQRNSFGKALLFQAILIIAGLLDISSCKNKQPSTPVVTINAELITADSINKEKDIQFLVSVVRINLEEIKLGQLAQQKGNLADVKDLGKMMVDDHTKAQSDLTALAMKKSITIPTTLDSNAQPSLITRN